MSNDPEMSPGMRELVDLGYDMAGVPKPARADATKLFPIIGGTPYEEPEVLPMEGELGAAGLAPSEARFIAGQLARMGYKLVKAEPKPQADTDAEPSGTYEVSNSRLDEIANERDNFYRDEIKVMAAELLSLRPRSVVREIAAERRRQIEDGRDAVHDDELTGGELASAAAAYAVNDFALWPWASEWWKPKDRRRNYVRAAALLIAEIERMDRHNAEVSR